MLVEEAIPARKCDREKLLPGLGTLGGGEAFRGLGLRAANRRGQLNFLHGGGQAPELGRHKAVVGLTESARLRPARSGAASEVRRVCRGTGTQGQLHHTLPAPKGRQLGHDRRQVNHRRNFEQRGQSLFHQGGALRPCLGRLGPFENQPGVIERAVV